METAPDFMPTLKKGTHRSPKDGACVMEYVSYITGDRWTDFPTCTPRSLAILAQVANDNSADGEREKLMLPLMPRLIGQGQDEGFDRLLTSNLNSLAMDKVRTHHLYSGICGDLRCCSMPVQIGSALNVLAAWQPSRGRAIHSVLVMALDLYDAYLDRAPVEVLTEEQTKTVREVHALVTAP